MGTPGRTTAIETVTDERAVHAVASGGALLVGFYDEEPSGAGPDASRVAGLERELADLVAELDPPVRAVAVNVRCGGVLARVAGVEQLPALVVFSSVCPVFHHVGDVVSPDLVADVAAALEEAGPPDQRRG